jgi:hypothetical protein
LRNRTKSDAAADEKRAKQNDKRLGRALSVSCNCQIAATTTINTASISARSNIHIDGDGRNDGVLLGVNV